MCRSVRTVVVVLAWLTITAGSSGCAPDVYVAFGDSVTKGVGDDNLGNGEGFPPLLSAILQAPDNTVVNAGVPGDTSSDGAKKINNLLANHANATHFLIQFGTNDAREVTSVSVEAYRNNLRSILQAVIDAGKRPLLAKVPMLYRGKDSTQPPCDLDSPSTRAVNQRIRQYNQVIDDLVVEYDLVIALGQPLTAPDFYGYFKSTTIDLSGKSVEFSDCIHPNDAERIQLASTYPTIQKQVLIFQ